MADLTPDVEQQLADMTDGQWSALTAKVRAPDSTEALRTAAAQLLSGDALNSFCTVADPSKFLGADGKIDPNKVQAHIRTAYGITGQQQQRQNHGQGSGGNGPALRPGDSGRAAAAKRHGTTVDPETAAAAATSTGRGSAGKAAAARRFPQQQKEPQ